MLNSLKYILISMRPKQWVKNVFIFTALIFSRNLLQADLLARVSAGFVLFSLAASGIYFFNDIKDIVRDRSHPEKCRRPLAAGLLSTRAAYGAFIGLVLIALSLALVLDKTFFAILAFYIGMNIAYTLKVKDIVILDVMFLAFGFVIRVLAGTALAGVMPSDWLILCTITISLFLGFSKRRHEISSIGDSANNHRQVLAQYSVPFLDQMISIATACTVMSYALYTVAEDTVHRFGTRHLVFTIPFVLYGLYRYLYLIHKREKGGNPATALLGDYPLVLNGFLWLIVVLLIIY